MGPLLYTEILRHLLSAVSNEEAGEKIQELEVGLASGEWCHDRIEFLKVSQLHAWDIALDCHQARVYRITIPKMRKIARRGLTQAWKDGIISAIEIGAFADDIASLQQFSNVLAEADFKGYLNPVWEHALDLPPNLPPVRADLFQIYQEIKKRQEKKS